MGQDSTLSLVSRWSQTVSTPKFNLKQILLSNAEDFMEGIYGRADPPVITLALPLAVCTFVY